MSAANAVTLVIEKLRAWLSALVLMLPNLVIALLVVVAFSLLSRPIGRLIIKVLHRVSRRDAIISLISKTAVTAVVLIGLLIALAVLDLDKTVTSLLAGVGVIGIALGFAFQDIAANFMSGILISLQSPCEEGDLVKTGNYTGKVQRIALRSTAIRTFQGPIVIIPNKDILQSPLTNFTRSGQRRVEIKVGVAYSDDLERARSIAIEAVRPMKCRNEEREIEVHYEEFADSSINFTLWLWVNYAEERDYVAARSEAIIRLKKAFDASGIAIPFPTRTLDFEIKGGDALARMLMTLQVSDAADPRAAWCRRTGEPGEDTAEPRDDDPAAKRPEA